MKSFRLWPYSAMCPPVITSKLALQGNNWGGLDMRFFVVTVCHPLSPHHPVMNFETQILCNRQFAFPHSRTRGLRLIPQHNSPDAKAQLARRWGGSWRRRHNEPL